jgi:S-adenosylmethionine:tRNA ribosyltransferase-isomerase
VVRAVESGAGEGWTDLVIEPDSLIEALDGLLTGFHDRDSSHLAMLEAIAGRDLLERSYEEAARAGYLRHEFGDLHLVLP